MRSHTTVLRTAFVMCAVLLIGFWIPIPFIPALAAGLVGGTLARSLMQALGAATIVSLLLPAALFLVGSPFSTVVGGVFAAAAFLFTLTKVVALFLGAALGFALIKKPATTF